MNFLSKPLLSVVIPGYNVEEYIEECLDSLVNQTFTDFEVIMVDDGSPDGTGAIMDRYASNYANFIVVHNENGGLSAARNSGLTYCSGEFVAFVDSDDVLPEDAYQLMMGALQKSGSDVATGAVRRFNSKKEVNSFLHKKGIHDTVLHTDLHAHPELVYDTTSWNKVYRRSLLLEHKITFPVGYLYEDIAYVLEAFLNAKGIDIIDKPVYKWRWREGNNHSITQQRNNLTLVEHRMIAVRKALKLAKDFGYDDLFDEISVKALEIDLSLFLPEPADADLDYVADFQKLAYRYMQELDYKRYLNKVTPQKQARLWALVYGDLDTMVGYTGRGNWGTALVKRGNSLVLNHDSFANKPWAKMISVDKSVPLVTKIGKVNQISEQHYEIKAAAYPKFSKDITHRNEDISVNLININNGDKIAVPFKRTKTNLVRHLIFKAKVGMDIDLDFSELKNKMTPGLWKLQISDRLFNVFSENFLGGPVKRAGQMSAFTLGDYVLKPEYNYNWQLTMRVESVDNKLSDVALTEGRVALTGRFTKDVALVGLRSVATDTDTMFPVTGGDGQHLSATIDKPLTGSKFEIVLLDQFLNEIDYQGNFGTAPKFDSGNSPQVLTMKSPLVAVVERLNGKVTLDDIKKNGAECAIRLSTKLDLQSAKSISLRVIRTGKSSRHIFDQFTIGTDGISFNIYLEETGKSLLDAGTYDIYLDVLTDVVKSYRVRAGKGFVAKNLAQIGNYQLRTDINKSGLLTIVVTQKWTKLNSSTLKRRIGYSIIYPLFRLLPINKNLVAYDSLWSSAINDNPRGMYEYLYKNHPELKHAWLLMQTNKVDAGPAEQVRKNSLRYWYVLATAHYLIENTNLPNQYSKRRGQVEVQTYHGTFMKTMGFDEPHFKNASNRIRNNFSRRISRWDLVITPSKYMTSKVRSAYGYEGEIIESGYPRNDALISNNNEEYITELKKKLGIPLDKKVVLYAPTFRNQSGFDLDLDLDKMRKQLGEEYIFLVRLHYFVANSINIAGYKPFALDVSNYPNINDLYLIADCLITDYSSVMFDFGYLRKPSLYFAYDKAEYTGDARGVYLDYDNVVPGPIVTTNDEIVSALNDLEGMRRDYADKREAFYNRFCEFGRDGLAAQKASERMLQIKQSDSATEPLIRAKFKIVTRFNKWYPAYLRYVGKKPKKNLIVFESFFGRNYSDNPKGLYEYMRKNYPNYKYVWNVNPEYVDYFKQNHIPYVQRLTLRGARVTGRAKYWIMNTRLPLWMNKPQGTKVIQTWHGTPLKTIGRDVELVTMPNKTTDEYHADIVQDSSRWDYCLAPNDYSSEIFKRAFRLRNEQMINSGYPRNDVLANHDDARISSLKHKLGISEDKKVVLYAPTWRDNEYLHADFYTAKLHLDLAKMKAEFGDDMVLLIRTHYLISSQLHLENDSFAIDVSDYEDISDLYLVSDILITDYSSVFFDYANLKRPIIFYAYDLAEYGGEIRGFYFDYHKEAPGKIIENEPDLYTELHQQIEHPTLSANYDEFMQKYCEWDDGLAAKRAADFVLNNQKYGVRKLDFVEKKIEITNDIALWSAVIGSEGYHIMQNLLANGQRAIVDEAAVLVDPIRNNDVGDTCYHLRVGDMDGWVSEQDYLNQTATK